MLKAHLKLLFFISRCILMPKEVNEHHFLGSVLTRKLQLLWPLVPTYFTISLSSIICLSRHDINMKNPPHYIGLHSSVTKMRQSAVVFAIKGGLAPHLTLWQTEARRAIASHTVALSPLKATAWEARRAKD